MKKNEGRIHIGTVTAKDCEWQYFRAGGKGGQSQNKTDSACRVTHKPSGAVGESREHKSQLQNRRAAFRRMAETKEFTRWVTRQASEDAKSYEDRQRELEAAVTRQVAAKNLLVEVRDNDEWVVVKGATHNEIDQQLDVTLAPVSNKEVSDADTSK